MAVNFIPAAYPAGGVMPSAIGPSAPSAGLGVASPLAGLLGSDGGAASADPGMMKLAQALLAKRMKPPVPGAMTPGGPSSLVPVPGVGSPAPLPPGAMGPPS